jgi:NitT/TauT family transport system ATP-binding protein
MKQRVALARALVVKPQLLLMDEPFGALDDTSRSTMQRELTRIWSELKPSVLFITHSVDEALLLADRIIVMTKADNSRSQSTGLIKADIRLDEARPRELSKLGAYRQQILDSLASASMGMAEGHVSYDAGI